MLIIVTDAGRSGRLLEQNRVPTYFILVRGDAGGCAEYLLCTQSSRRLQRPFGSLGHI